MLPYHLPSLCNTFMNLVCELWITLVNVTMRQNLKKCIFIKQSAYNKWDLVNSNIQVFQTFVNTDIISLTKERKQQQKKKKKPYLLNTNILSNISN